MIDFFREHQTVINFVLLFFIGYFIGAIVAFRNNAKGEKASETEPQIKD